MIWLYHVYEHQTHAIWGYGYGSAGKVWEYFGIADGPDLKVKWTKHDSRDELRALENTLEISLNQRSMEQMEKLVPDFENRLMATLIYEKMEDRHLEGEKS